MVKTMITAHSGCEGTEIDSLESIDRALEFGADCVEMDIRVDQAGTLRISHNACTMEEYAEKLIFRDVLEKLLPTSLSLNCDLKEQAGLYKVIEEAEAVGFPADRLGFSGCVSPEQLARDPKLRERAFFFLNIEEVLKMVWLRHAPDFSMEQFSRLMADPWLVLRNDKKEIPAELITPEIVKETIGYFKVLHPAAVNMPKILLGTPLVDAMMQAGLQLSVWTVNEPELVEQCLDLNVLNITTKKVEQAEKLKEIRNQK